MGEQKNCDCYTLQAADSKSVVVVRNATATLGLIAAFELVVLVLACAIIVRLRWHRGQRLPWG
jgi:hypothetical protein